MYGTLSDNFLVKQGLAPQVSTIGAEVKGGGVDCAGFETALLIAEVGAIVDGATKSVALKIQESDDDVDGHYADIASATTGAILYAGENSPYLIDVNLSQFKRWLRAVNIGGAADGGLVGGTWILGKGRHLPPTQENTVVRVGYS